MVRIALIAAAALMLPAQAPKEAPPPPPRPAPSGPSAEQCRMTCAQRYYFCLAEAEQEICSPAWAQCRTACGSSLPR